MQIYAHIQRIGDPLGRSKAVKMISLEMNHAFNHNNY